MFNKEKCKECIHYVRNTILTDVIQDLIRWGFTKKTKAEKKKHPIWDKIKEGDK